jgi:hypothetical protein
MSYENWISDCLLVLGDSQGPLWESAELTKQDRLSRWKLLQALVPGNLRNVPSVPEFYLLGFTLCGMDELTAPRTE